MIPLTVIVPTIPGRERWLRRMVRSVHRTAPGVELVRVRGFGNCGDAWADGIRKATRRFVWFAADDFQMTEPGWWLDPLRIASSGAVPAPLIFHTDGTVQSCGGAWQKLEPDGDVTAYSRAPLIQRAWWELAEPWPAGLHYYTDALLCDRLGQHGIRTVVCQSFAFTHHLAAEGRHDESIRRRDETVYGRARAA